jgi:hypothetical protein
MPFEFTCPFCHHETKVDDKFAGQSGPCVSCGRTILMPVYDSAGVLVAPASQPKPAVRRQSKSNKLGWGKIAVAIASLLILSALTITTLWVGVPMLRKKASVAAQRADSENLKSITNALNAYAAKYGTYPTPVVKDDKGKPLYSWRVLILPFMGYEGLYQRFQLDQAHDSIANLTLLREMPKEYGSSFTASRSGSQTNYALLVGPSTLFPSSGPLGPSDAEPMTILLVETLEGIATWTEPKDIDTTVGFQIGARPMRDIGGIHSECALIGTTEGEVYSIPSATPQLTLDAMMSPANGEAIDASSFREL